MILESIKVASDSGQFVSAAFKSDTLWRFCSFTWFNTGKWKSSDQSVDDWVETKAQELLICIFA